MLLLIRNIFSKTTKVYFVLVLNIIFFQKIHATQTKADSLNDNEIRSKIIYSAIDSIITINDSNKIKLYNEANVTYEKIKLEAPLIIIDFNKKEIIGKKSNDQKATFHDGEKNYYSDYVKYNFKTKKGFSKNTKTSENQGFLESQKIKSNNDSIFYLYKGGFTTCDHEEPHFAIKSKKIKILSNKSIITGPAYLEINRKQTTKNKTNKINIQKIPIVALPFAIFPNLEQNTSGIIFPSYGESQNLGFFLRDMGYHFHINNKLSTSIKTDIYSKGSWGLKSLINYKKRYKYKGYINLNYSSLKNGYKNSPNYTDKRDFMFKWQHIKDPKSDPNNNISINLNLGTSTYNRNNSYNYSEYLNNTLRSNISLIKKFQDKPYSLNLSVSHYQNTITNSISITSPDLIFRIKKMNLQELTGIQKTKILQKTNFSYNLHLKNEINTIDSILFSNTKIQDFSNGIRHQIPISQSFNLLKYFIITPKFNYSELWHFKKTIKTLGPLDELQEERINGFYRNGYYDFTTNISTKIFGSYKINKMNIKGMRHTITPSINFIYKPEISKNYFDSYTNLLGEEIEYFLYENNAFFIGNNQKSSKIALNISNILELKKTSRKDSNNVIKRKIIDNFNISTGYNIYSDNFNFQLINIYFSTKLIENMNFNINSSYDPYIWENGYRTEKMHIEEGKLAELKNINISLDYNLKKIKDFPVKTNIRYNLNYFNDNISTNSINLIGELELPKKWKINFITGYDILNKAISYSSFNINKDLHCWEMKINWIPFGYHRSYNVVLKVKSNILKDIKIEKRKDWFDYIN